MNIGADILCAADRQLFWSCRRWLRRCVLTRLALGVLVLHHLLGHLQVIFELLGEEKSLYAFILLTTICSSL